MPLGPFDPIPPRSKNYRSHINELREALTGVQDAYDVAVADGFVGSHADFIASLKSTEPGPANTLTIGTVAYGETANATITGLAPNQTLNLTLPKGDTGSDGVAATVSVGTTMTGAPGTDALVTQGGTPQARTLNFTIPRGAEGPEGPAGSAVDIIGVVDGGAPESVYGGTTTIDGGSV